MAVPLLTELDDLTRTGTYLFPQRVTAYTNRVGGDLSLPLWDPPLFIIPGGLRTFGPFLNGALLGPLQLALPPVYFLSFPPRLGPLRRHPRFTRNFPPGPLRGTPLFRGGSPRPSVIFERGLPHHLRPP